MITRKMIDLIALATRQRHTFPLSVRAMSSPDPQPTGSVPKSSAPAVNWNEIAQDPDFKKLVASKLRFIVPATAFFVVYYFALPILVGWFPELMKKKVIGSVNLAYLFALSQFFMAWILAFIYVGVAAGWDKRAAALLVKFKH